MGEALLPFDEIRTFKSFTLFIEKEASEFFSEVESVESIFVRIGKTIQEIPFKEPGQTAITRGSLVAGVQQFITQIINVKKCDKYDLLVKSAHEWSLAAPWETNISGHLLIHALNSDTAALEKLIIEIDTCSADLDISGIRGKLLELLERVSERHIEHLKHLRRDGIKRNAVQLNINFIKFESWYMDKENNSVGNRFITAVFTENLLNKSYRGYYARGLAGIIASVAIEEDNKPPASTPHAPESTTTAVHARLAQDETPPSANVAAKRFKLGKCGPKPSKDRDLYAIINKAYEDAETPRKTLESLKKDPKYREFRDTCKERDIVIDKKLIKRARSQKYRDSKAGKKR